MDDFKERLDHLWDTRAPDAIEVIRMNRLLSMASKEEDIGFYSDQQGPTRSMSGNEKIFAAKKRTQKATKEREKKARCHSDEDAGQSSEYELSADPDGSKDGTEVKAGDEGDAGMQDPGTRGTDTGRRRRSPSTFPVRS